MAVGSGETVAVGAGVAVAGASPNVTSVVTFCPGIVNLLSLTAMSCPSAPLTVTIGYKPAVSGVASTVTTLPSGIKY